ncbi:hypothetical protein HK097_005351 [Rhizophlyctis rosea]|uniref:Uncharacterized protein n=1 Tax=Rhizophlyctis rosea TaxID=64517 RepID=A0AAD5SF04_9FUNG|nr:hypothetical protein HK097_005351 [Rhizophlyctis rosea]
MGLDCLPLSVLDTIADLVANDERYGSRVVSQLCLLNKVIFAAFARVLYRSFHIDETALPMLLNVFESAPRPRIRFQPIACESASRLRLTFEATDSEINHFDSAFPKTPCAYLVQRLSFDLSAFQPQQESKSENDISLLEALFQLLDSSPLREILIYGPVHSAAKDLFLTFLSKHPTITSVQFEQSNLIEADILGKIEKLTNLRICQTDKWRDRDFLHTYLNSDFQFLTSLTIHALEFSIPYVSMPVLRSLTLIECSLRSVLNFVTQVEHHLEQLTLKEIGPVFNDRACQETWYNVLLHCPYVQALKIRLRYNRGHAFHTVGFSDRVELEVICPDLQYFTLQHGYLSVDSFRQLVECPRMRCIRGSLLVPVVASRPTTDSIENDVWGMEGWKQEFEDMVRRGMKSYEGSLKGGFMIYDFIGFTSEAIARLRG